MFAAPSDSDPGVDLLVFVNQIWGEPPRYGWLGYEQLVFIYQNGGFLSHNLGLPSYGGFISKDD